MEEKWRTLSAIEEVIKEEKRWYLQNSITVLPECVDAGLMILSRCRPRCLVCCAGLINTHRLHYRHAGETQLGADIQFSKQRPGQFHTGVLAWPKFHAIQNSKMTIGIFCRH